MIHLLYELIDIVAHSLELVAQLLVFSFKVTFLLFVVSHALDLVRCVLHSGQPFFGLLKCLLYEAIRVALYDSAKGAFGQLGSCCHDAFVVVVSVVIGKDVARVDVRLLFGYRYLAVGLIINRLSLLQSVCLGVTQVNRMLQVSAIIDTRHIQPLVDLHRGALDISSL